MKAVAIIQQLDSAQGHQWQLDKILAGIAYDIDLSVVFMPTALAQMTANMAWKCLPLYGVEKIYFYNAHQLQEQDYKPLIATIGINAKQLQQMIVQADIVL